MSNQDILNIIPEPQIVCLQGLKSGWTVKADGRSSLDLARELVEGFHRQQSRLIRLFEIPIALRRLDEAELKVPAPMRFSREEGYILVIDETGVMVAADSSASTFYALQTVGQIFAQFDSQPLPTLTIIDWPILMLRGQHVCYHLVMEFMPYSAPSFEALLEMVRTLAHYKINFLLLELEAMFPYEKYPEIACKIAFSRQQIEELRTVCKENHVQVMPLLQCLGHAYAVLRHPRFAHLREQLGTTQQYCPSNLATRDLYLELADEILEGFPETRYFHVGGDEAGQLGQCKKCREIVSREGFGALYGRHVGALCSDLLSRNIMPVVWSDMIERYPDALKFIPENTIIDYWNYDPWAWPRHGGFDQFPITRQIIGSPAVRWGSHSHTMYLHPNAMRGIATMTHEAIRREKLGIIVTDWVKAVPWELSWIGRIYTAEEAWGHRSSWTNFERKFAQLHFGVNEPTFLEAYTLLSDPLPYCEDSQYHQVDALERYDLSGLSTREKLIMFTSENKRVRTVTALEKALAKGQKALNVLKEVSAEVVMNRREYNLLALSARTNIHKAEMGLTFDRCVRLLKYPVPDDEKQRHEVVAALSRLISEWEELRRETENLLRLGTFAPVAKRMLDVKFAPDTRRWMERFLKLLVSGQVVRHLFQIEDST